MGLPAPGDADWIYAGSLLPSALVHGPVAWWTLQRDRQTKREVFHPSFSAAMDCEGRYEGGSSPIIRRKPSVSTVSVVSGGYLASDAPA
jgi:hypothetical protein